MLLEPLADVDVNVPGVMAILVAPAAAQLSVLLVPELILVGSAVKEVIVGTEPFPEGELDEVVAPQPASATQANRMRTSAQISSPEELSFRELSLFPQNELVESMRNPQQTQPIAHAVVAVTLSGRSPLDHCVSSQKRVIRVIRRSTIERFNFVSGLYKRSKPR